MGARTAGRGIPRRVKLWGTGRSGRVGSDGNGLGGGACDRLDGLCGGDRSVVGWSGIEQEGQEMKRARLENVDAAVYGDECRVELHYPEISVVKKLVIGLSDVRAADDVRVSYDYERDGWKIEQASVFSWKGEDNVCDPVVATQTARPVRIPNLKPQLNGKPTLHPSL